MMSGSQSPVAKGIPLVLPTNAKQPFAKLVVRGEHGQIVQQWLVLQNKCTLGSASACALRCQLPGIAAYHALLVLGNKQVFIRALSPKLTRNGVNVNEILLSEGENAFEIAGHRFELLRNLGPTESPKATNKPAQNERLKFTLARPFELTSRRREEPTPAAPIIEAPAAYDPSLMPKWITDLIQSAVQPLEQHIQSIVEPLAIAQAEIEKQNRTERRAQSKTKRKRPSQPDVTQSRDTIAPQITPVAEPIIVAPQVPAPTPTAKVESLATISPAIEAILEKQNASIEKLVERLHSVTDQLGALERTVSDNIANPPKPVVEATSPAYDETLLRITAVTERLSGMMQDLQSRQLALESSDQNWRDTLSRQIDQLQEKISATEKSFQDSARNSVDQARNSVDQAVAALEVKSAEFQAAVLTANDQAIAALELKSAEFQATVLTANDQAIAKFRDELREEAAAIAAAQQTVLQQAEANLQKANEASMAQISRQIAAQAIQMPAVPTPPARADIHPPVSAQPIVAQPVVAQPIVTQPVAVQPVVSQSSAVQPIAHAKSNGFEGPLASAVSPSSWIQEEEIAQQSNDHDASDYQESTYAVNQLSWDASPVPDQNTYAIESRGPEIELEQPAEEEQNIWLKTMPKESASEPQPAASSPSNEGAFAQLPSWWTEDDKSQFEDDRTLSMSRASVPVENNSYVQDDLPSNAYQDAGSDHISEWEAENGNRVVEAEPIPRSESTWSQPEPSSQSEPVYEAPNARQFESPAIEREEVISAKSSESVTLDPINDFDAPKSTPLDSVESRELAALLERFGAPQGQAAPENSFATDPEEIESPLDVQDDLSEEAALASEIESNYRQKESERATLNALRSDLGSIEEDLDVQPTSEEKPAAAPNVDAESQEGEEDEESIEEYMKRLMARMRGDSEPVEEKKSEPKSQPMTKQSTPRDPSEIKPPVRKTEPAVQSRTTAHGAATTSAFNPDEYVPKALAPEKSRNMAAMRELANTSARSAIQVSARRKYSTAVALKLVIAATGFGVGCALIMLNGFKVNIGLIATVASFMVALIWGIDAAGTIKPLLNQDAATPVGDGNAKEPVKEAEEEI